jgi:uncharacterized protein
MKYLLLVFSVIMMISCTNQQHAYNDEQVVQFKHEFEKYVKEKNEYLKSEDNSPLLKEDRPDFISLHFYDYDPNFRFEGPITIYEKPDTVIIYGSKNDERPSLKYGNFEFPFNGKSFQLQIFKILPRKPHQSDYLFLGFTDKTSNVDTYGGGRYINLELNKENHYIVDFNYAYNPYCAYNPKYSCAIPTKEEHLEIAIEAGEKKYHE